MFAVIMINTSLTESSSEILLYQLLDPKYQCMIMYIFIPVTIKMSGAGVHLGLGVTLYNLT